MNFSASTPPLPPKNHFRSPASPSVQLSRPNSSLLLPALTSTSSLPQCPRFPASSSSAPLPDGNSSVRHSEIPFLPHVPSSVPSRVPSSGPSSLQASMIMSIPLPVPSSASSLVPLCAPLSLPSPVPSSVSSSDTFSGPPSDAFSGPPLLTSSVPPSLISSVPASPALSLSPSVPPSQTSSAPLSDTLSGPPSDTSSAPLSDTLYVLPSQTLSATPSVTLSVPSFITCPVPLSVSPPVPLSVSPPVPSSVSPSLPLFVPPTAPSLQCYGSPSPNLRTQDSDVTMVDAPATPSTSAPPGYFFVGNHMFSLPSPPSPATSCSNSIVLSPANGSERLVEVGVNEGCGSAATNAVQALVRLNGGEDENTVDTLLRVGAARQADDNMAGACDYDPEVSILTEYVLETRREQEDCARKMRVLDAIHEKDMEVFSGFGKAMLTPANPVLRHKPRQLVFVKQLFWHSIHSHYFLSGVCRGGRRRWKSHAA